MTAAPKVRTFTDCVLYCFENRELVEQFNRLFGCTLGVGIPRSSIEAMVDRACGHNPAMREDEAQLFIHFVYDSIWSRLPDECFEQPNPCFPELSDSALNRSRQ